jgi:uncharacterized membrane protein YoaK (UPF0700 family)
MSVSNLHSSRERRERKDIVAAPIILLSMTLIVTTVLRPQMERAPLVFVLCTLGGCVLQFVTLLAMFFEGDRRGADRWLLTTATALLAVTGALFSASVSPTASIFACYVPSMLAAAAAVILRPPPQRPRLRVLPRLEEEGVDVKKRPKRSLRA